MPFMVAAYLVIWLASFAFIISMVRRQANLQREISALRELVQERPGVSVNTGSPVVDAK
jgi:CcmD family protein